ncbi:hypothetical protein FMEXI_11881 [Fusarium mexicanum]|uniref:C2H2-type domain-containing protein n=1 Tax=Fusarium mexicanum TaxID=751941 RepID=A0A8H5IC34_9HYPO|nr:hypothetical protein FMEXI_11881 [Fusarium mexicanum]
MTNNEAPGPVVQEKQPDNRRTLQYNEVPRVNDTIKDTYRGRVIGPQKDYFGMTTLGKGPENPKAVPFPSRTAFRDQQSLAFWLPSSADVSHLDGQPKGGPDATSLPKSEFWEQTSEEEDLKTPLLLDDEIPAKTFNLKRRAEDIVGFNKRSRNFMATDEDDEDDDVVSVPRPRREYLSFACPFYRKVPSRHIECLSLTLTRISDVKQHLKRRHTPNFSCTRCEKGFASSKDYEDHVRQRTCTITDREYNHGVSPAAQEALRSRLDKSLSPENQWFKIWETLFRDDGHPPNPYHDGVFKEVTGIIRGIWRSKEQSIISSLRDGGIFVKEEQTVISSLKETLKIHSAGQLRSLVFEILTRVENSFEQKGKTSSRNKPQERPKITTGSTRGPSEERNVEENYETSLGVQGLKDNTGQLEIDERYTLPLQDWPFPADFGTSDNVFTCFMHPGYRNGPAEDPCDDLSTSLPNHDEEGNWPLIGSTCAGAVDNFMSQQTSESVKDCIFVESDLTSAQIPTMFD